METTRICPNCQKPLAQNAPQGLCPECLLKAGLGSGVDIGPETQSASGRVTFVAPPLEEIARLFPQLEIQGFIGQGGMGAVYRARQRELDRVVALKILPPDIGRDAAFAERFAREARAMAKLNHPGIVTLYEFGRADGLFFFLMEFVAGVNLGQLLEGGHLSSREALAIVPQICDALQYAHDQGIVHRDIKPQNILVDRRGRVKVADFGLAKLVGRGEETVSAVGTAAASSLTEVGNVMGTPQYMAPEQREHPAEVDHRADIYSLGVVFYQILTGELPGKPVEAPSRKVQVDVRLDEVVLRAMEQKPERRYQQASQVKTDVETIAGYQNFQAALTLDRTPSPLASPPAAPHPQPAAQPNHWETAFIAAGLTIFVLLMLLIPTASSWARPLLAFSVALGLPICFLSLAGWWPAPSYGVPDSGYSRRNLHRLRELSAAAFISACLSGLISTIFYWLAPWLVPGLTPQGREVMLWLAFSAAFIALITGIGARQTRLGQVALVVGALNLSLCVLFLGAGIFSSRPLVSFGPVIESLGGGQKATEASANRKFVRLVADAAALTFAGQLTSWDEVGALLARVPDRRHTVLELAVTSDQITVAQQNEWLHKASRLARQHGFEYASFIGVHPPGPDLATRPAAPPMGTHAEAGAVSTNAQTLSSGPAKTPARLNMTPPTQPAGKLSALIHAENRGELRISQLAEPNRARALALFNDIEDFSHEFEAAFAATNLAAAQTGVRRLAGLLTNFNTVVEGTDCQFPSGLFDDLAKVRQALEQGDWEKAKRLARHNETYAREFRRIGAEMAALARANAPFVVTGRVTDAAGQGLAGVAITAHCGVGTLLPTGRTTTGPDGRYTLRFTAGLWMMDGDRQRVGVQAATISPSKPGYAEAKLHRQGDLLMADRMPESAELARWKAEPGKMILPNQPFPLDFVLLPAATLNGQLVDAKDRPLAAERIYLSGPELPPSSSVLAGTQTDAQGRFQFENVPARRQWWFMLPGHRDAQSRAVTFEQAGEHRVRLRLISQAGKPALEVADPEP